MSMEFEKREKRLAIPLEEKEMYPVSMKLHLPGLAEML